MSELKLCPFCGGEAEVFQTDPEWEESYVGCSGCGCVLSLEEDEAAAIAAWNQRTEPDRSEFMNREPAENITIDGSGPLAAPDEQPIRGEFTPAEGEVGESAAEKLARSLADEPVYDDGLGPSVTLHPTYRDEIVSTPRTLAAENGRLVKLVDHWQQEYAQAYTEQRALCEAAKGNYWLWQGDGEDDLPTLVCPVLIRPEVLLEITAENERLKPEVEKMRVAHDDTIDDLVIMRAQRNRYRKAIQQAIGELEGFLHRPNNDGQWEENKIALNILKEAIATAEK